MKIAKVLLIIAAVAAGLFAVAQGAITFLLSRSSVTVSAVEPLPHGERVQHPQSADFWQAMENLDLGYLEQGVATDEERQFGEAVQMLLDARLSEAENRFRTLYRTASDTLLQTRSGLILGSILFFQSEWVQFMQLVEGDPRLLTVGHLDETERIFASALRDAPHEVYHFPAKRTTLATRLTRTGNPMIEVTVNGRRRFFVLDTGAGLSVVGSHVAAACKIAPLGEEIAKAGTSTDIKIDARPAIIRELKLGALTIENHPVAIIAERDLEFDLLGLRILKIDGIIGWPVFKDLVLEIDYDEKTTTISQSLSNPESDRNLFWLGYPLVMLRSEDGVPLYFGLDTGAATTGLKQHAFGKITAENITTSNKLRIGAGGGERTVSKKVSDLTLFLDGHRLYFDNISSTEGVNAAFLVEPDGKLGSDVAADGKIIVDYRSGRFELEIKK